MGVNYQPSQEVPMQTLHGWLRPEWEPRKEKFVAKMRFTERVAKEEKGPMHALSRFQWDTAVRNRARLQRQPSKDFVDCLRYLAGHPGMRAARLLARKNGAGQRARRTAASYRTQGAEPQKILFGRCLLYTSPSPRDRTRSRMPSSA